jgi:hypothetical protein
MYIYVILYQVAIKNSFYHPIDVWHEVSEMACIWLYCMYGCILLDMKFLLQFLFIFSTAAELNLEKLEMSNKCTEKGETYAVLFLWN